MSRAADIREGVSTLHTFGGRIEKASKWLGPLVEGVQEIIDATTRFEDAISRWWVPPPVRWPVQAMLFMVRMLILLFLLGLAIVAGGLALMVVGVAGLFLRWVAGVAIGDG